MHWRERYGEKLVSAEQAAAQIQSGQRLWTGMLNSVPLTFARSLHARRGELRNVKIVSHLTPFDWLADGGGEAFRPTTCFASSVDRGAVRDGLAEYLPMGNFDREHWLRFHPRFDVGVARMSPPDENGYMSFGAGLWLNKTMRMLAGRWFAEIDEHAIRTHGDNYLHVSQVDCFFEREPSDDMKLPIQPRDAEVEASATVVCTLVAEELIEDGDCLQIGIGDVSAALPAFLGNRQELGIQTELFGGGIIDLIEQGVVTGSRKTVAVGKAVGSGFAQVAAEELERAHMHPQVELWDFCDTDDLRMLVQNDHFKTINNALQIDLTGQVTAETLRGEVFSGPGGQTVFAMAGSYSRGGASIIVLPSSSVVGEERMSRIVPRLAEGTMVTVPRTFVDYVVTEQGVAALFGKSVGERLEELLSVAHPDLRADLRQQASQVYAAV